MSIVGEYSVQLLFHTIYVGELCHSVPALQQHHLRAPGQGQGEGPDQPDGLTRDPTRLPNPSPGDGEPSRDMMDKQVRHDWPGWSLKSANNVKILIKGIGVRQI